jgi:hypothetical protein
LPTTSVADIPHRMLPQGAQERSVPTKNGSVTDAPEGGHSTQCGAASEAAAGDGADDDAAAPDAGVVAAGEATDDDVPGLGVVDVVVDAVAEGVVAVIAGKLTAPDDPICGLVPAVPGAVVAVCAAAGPASAIRSASAMPNSWAMAPVQFHTRRIVMRSGAARSSPAGRSPILQTQATHRRLRPFERG